MYAKKSLGQHFLTSTSTIRKIILASGVSADDTVLEIGPGRGVLTRALLETNAYVVAVEKDDNLIPVLKETFKTYIATGKLHLIHADILECDIQKLITTKYHLVANIPYYITGQIIRMFLESPIQPLSMTLLVQKEVAVRILARDKKESLLSLSVKVFGTPTLISTVPRGAFTPTPNVDSAIIHIRNISHAALHGIEASHFFEILHLGFAHKRKQLFSNLSQKYSKDTLSSAFEKLAIPLKIRAEDLSLSEWITLSKNLE